MLSYFFTWWYGEGFKSVVRGIRPRLSEATQTFSLDQILRTLFSPWKRIISSPNRSLSDKFRAFVDNSISRVIGFIVRLSILIVASIYIIGILIFNLLLIVLWPLLPVLVIVFIILGVIKL